MQSPKKKVTLYFNSGMLAETQREAVRQDRSISWIIQAAWRLAKDDVRKLPGAGVPAPAPSPPTPPPAQSTRSEGRPSSGSRRVTN